jgi:peptidyl-prolyl cis-trans isomerase SurA
MDLTLNLDKIINAIKLVSLMLRKVFLYLLVCSSLCSMSFAQAFPAAKPKARNAESLDRIVAVINDTPITQSELTEAMNNIKRQMHASGGSVLPESILRKQVLEQIINRKLQLEIAGQAGLKITDEQLTKAIGGIASQNKISTKELMSKVVSSGMSETEYRKEIREEMLIQEVEQSQVGSHITITPQEVDDFMRSAAWKASNNKEYHLEDILIAMPEAPSPQDIAQGKKKAELVIDKLHRGMSFKQVAMEDSGSSGALQGGDLGWRKLPQIPPAFSEPLIHMKANDVVGPVLTPNGYHIVRLVAVRDVETHTDAATQHKQVEQLIYQRRFEEDLQSWLTRLRSEAFINMNPEKV